MAAGSHELYLVPVPGGGAVIKRGVNELLVHGEQAHSVARALLASLRAGSEADDALADLSAEYQPAGRKLMEALQARGMLNGGESESYSSVEQQAFFANFGPVAQRAAEALRSGRVLVHGSGSVGCSLASALLEMGVRQVVVVGDSRFGRSERSSFGILAGGDDGRSALSVVAEDPDDLSGFSIMVGASDAGQEDALAELGRRALSAGLAYLPAWLSDLVGYVGPLTIPFETACMTCLMLRLDSNDTNVQARRALRAAAGEQPGLAASAGFLPPMASVVGQVAAMEVAKHLGGFAPTDSIGRLIEINLVSFTSCSRRVLKVPRCPDCADTSRQATRGLFVGPQISD